MTTDARAISAEFSRARIRELEAEVSRLRAEVSAHLGAIEVWQRCAQSAESERDAATRRAAEVEKERDNAIRLRDGARQALSALDSQWRQDRKRAAEAEGALREFGFADVEDGFDGRTIGYRCRDCGRSARQKTEVEHDLGCKIDAALTPSPPRVAEAEGESKSIDVSLQLGWLQRDMDRAAARVAQLVRDHPDAPSPLAPTRVSAGAANAEAPVAAETAQLTAALAALRTTSDLADQIRDAVLRPLAMGRWLQQIPPLSPESAAAFSAMMDDGRDDETPVSTPAEGIAGTPATSHGNWLPAASATAPGEDGGFDYQRADEPLTRPLPDKIKLTDPLNMIEDTTLFDASYLGRPSPTLPTAGLVDAARESDTLVSLPKKLVDDVRWELAWIGSSHTRDNIHYPNVVQDTWEECMKRAQNAYGWLRDALAKVEAGR